MINFLVGSVGVDVGAIADLVNENGVSVVNLAEISKDIVPSNENLYCILDNVEQLSDFSLNSNSAQVLLFYVSPHELLVQLAPNYEVKIISHKLETWFSQVENFNKLAIGSLLFKVLNFKECKQNTAEFISLVTSHHNPTNCAQSLIGVDSIKSQIITDIINQSSELTECCAKIADISHPLTYAGMKLLAEGLRHENQEESKRGADLLAELSRLKASHTAELSSRDNQVQELVIKLKASEVENQEESKRGADLLAELSRLKASHTAELSSRDNQVQELVIKLKASEVENQEESKRGADLLAELSRLKASHTAELSSRDNQVQELGNKANIQYDELKEKSILLLEDKIKEINNLKECVNNYEQKCLIVKAENEKLNDKINGLEFQKAEQEEISGKLSIELEQSQVMIKELNNKLTSELCKSKGVENQCVKAEAQIDLIKELILTDNKLLKLK